MSIIDEHNDDVYDQVRAILAEHFPNFLFAVMDDDGELFYDYTNLPIGKMLMREIRDDLEMQFAEDVIINWDEEEE